MGVENPSHRKSFDPLHDIGDCIMHFDFTKHATSYQFTKATGVSRISGGIASSGALTNNQIRLASGYYFSIDTCPDAGVVKIDSEYFSYSGYDNSGNDVTYLNNVTRAINLSSEASHSDGSTIFLVAGAYQTAHQHGGGGTPGTGTGLRDFSDWTTTELRIPNEGTAGGYITAPEDSALRPAGHVTSGLGADHRQLLAFDGTNDRLPLNEPITTTTGDFTVVMVFRMNGGPSSDCIVAGSSGGINQIKINANTLLFRCNSSGSSNSFNQIRANNTTAYSVGSRGTPVDKGGTSNSFLDNQNECLILVKEKDSTDNKEKVYLYDVKDLIGEDLLNSSGTSGQAGYPDSSENPSNTGLQIQHIGAFANNNSDYSGEVAVISLYDKALTADEIALLQEYYDNTYPDLHHE